VRVPPNDELMERAVLGAILQEPQHAYDDVVESGLKVSDFYREKHQEVFRVIEKLRGRGEPVDVLTVHAELNAAGVADKVGGAAYLNELWDSVPNPRHAAKYAAVLRNKSLIRQMIAISHDAAGKGYEEAGDFPELIGELQSKLISLATADLRRPFRGGAEMVKLVLDEVERRQSLGNGISGVPSGFTDLDYNFTKGFQPGSLVIVGARPAMGKTAFALSMATNAAMEHGRSVAVFSLEMDATELGLRLLAARASLNVQSLRSNGYKPSVADWERIMVATQAISRSRLFLDDSAPLRPSEIGAKCRQIHHRHGLDLVIVDYLQLMGHDGKIDSREQQISSISRALKLLARDLGICVIALSQLNRELEKRADKRPTLSDLRESGAIEQDADIILFLHREGYYRDLRGAAGDGQVGASPTDATAAELIVAKQRSGPTGIVQLTWQAWCTRFDNRLPDARPYSAPMQTRLT
jgi:replicative DNA helicase